jgi:hypothetical protein
MPSVTVDADDLEALLFALSAIGDIEKSAAQLRHAFDQRRTNPMVTSTKGKIEAAHERLAAAWRRAKREGDWPTRTISESDLDELRAAFKAPNGWWAWIIVREYPIRWCQDLLLVEAGPCFEGFQIAWPAPNEPQFCMGVQTAGASRHGARLNHYGRQLLGVKDEDLVPPEREAIVPRPAMPSWTGGRGRFTEAKYVPEQQLPKSLRGGPKALGGPPQEDVS